MEIRGKFKICSLEAIGTLGMDGDVGVVRVSGYFLRTHTRRNAMLRITPVDAAGRKGKAIIRIVRAATGSKSLAKDEIALQYDDRIELGIKKAGTVQELEIRSVNEWTGLPMFLLRHTSPLVRREAAFAFALMGVGAFIGFLAGWVAG
ncbi:MAG: hypothetical protein IH626_14965 [Rhodospirillales bacterium]|nr:hypothetical protein [Rhodospirillales bacterium]